jgi:hypothetical protein
MTTVAEIAREAFDAVAAEITDAIHPATLTRETQGAYNTTTGSYATTTTTQTGRVVVDTVKPVQDVFPEYVAGPGDELILIEGMTSAKENDELTFAGLTRIVRQAQDIVAAGSLFYVIVR